MLKRVAKGEGDRFLVWLMLGLLAFSIFVILGYVTYLFGGVILALTVYPLYSRLAASTQRPKLSALICVLLVILLLVMPLVSIAFFLFFSQGINYGQMEQSARIVSQTVNEILGSNIDLTMHLASARDAVVAYFFSNPTGIVSQAVDVFIGIFLMLIGLYYFLIDGPNILESAKKFTPLHSAKKDYLMAKLDVTMKSLLIGTFLTAIAQGLIAGISYFLFGVSNAALWTLLTMFFALLPIVGSGIVWVPLAIFQFLEGDVYSGIGLLLYNTLITATIDNIIRPVLVPEKANIHPLIVVAGVLGGVKALGFWGVIAGPLILALFVASVKAYAYKEETLKRQVRKIEKHEPGKVGKIYKNIKKAVNTTTNGSLRLPLLKKKQ